MTKEQYVTLPLTELKALAKARGLKGVTALKKSDLIERMLEEDKKDEALKAAQKAKEEAKKADEEEKAAKAAIEAGINEAKAAIRKTERKLKGSKAKAEGADVSSKAGGKSHKDLQEKNKEKSVNSDNKRSHIKDNAIRQRKKLQLGERSENSAKNEAADTSAKEETAEVREKSSEYRNESASSNQEAEKTEAGRLDSGLTVEGILEVMPEGFGFIRSDNFLPGDNDVYVSPSQIRRFGLKTGDVLKGNTRVKSQNEKFSALLYVNTINGLGISELTKRKNFEDLTPIFPNERIRLERPGCSVSMRIVDLISPIGKGQRGMIVSPPKAGKTTLLKEMAMSILNKNPEMHIIILLIDERPEEVTDMKETVYGPNVEVIYSTFDETPDHHRRVSEMVIERAKRLVESKLDVIIFIDSITRLARAYNQVVQSSGRTLSGGLDPSALHMPKRFFGAARNVREGGSLTILATALVDTGSKMDDVVYEEFKGTGNMELVLDRKLQERRIFPAIDIVKSGTRREDLLLNLDELEAINKMRRALNGSRSDDATENILNMFVHTKDNQELIRVIQKQKVLY